MKTLVLATTAIAALLAGDAHAQDTTILNPDFSDSAGKWDIEGVALGKGNTIVCKMQKEAENGQPFSYMFVISAGSDGVKIMDIYVNSTKFPENSSPRVVIFFNGKKSLELVGGVNKGLIHIDLTKLGVEKMIHTIELFKSSKTLVEVSSLKGYSTEKTTVDLTDAVNAFDKRGICSKVVMDIGPARLKDAN